MDERNQKSIDDLFHEVETFGVRPIIDADKSWHQDREGFRTLYDRQASTIYIAQGTDSCWACVGYDTIKGSLASFSYKDGLEGATLVFMEQRDHGIWPPQQPESDDVEWCTPQLMHRRIEALKRDFGIKEVKYITKNAPEVKT